MTSAELGVLLAQGENLHTEFKRWPLHPDDLAAAITAFANTDGGRIVMGVDDQGQVVGLLKATATALRRPWTMSLFTIFSRR